MDYDQDTRVLYKKMLWHEWRLPHNLVFIFQVENVSPGKEKCSISPTPFNRCSLSFHQNDCTISSHVILVKRDL